MGGSMGTVIDYAGGEIASSTGQWAKAKARARDDQTGSLTPFIGQPFHVSNTTHRGQTSAHEANRKQICHGLGELGFNPKSWVKRKIKSKPFVLSSTGANRQSRCKSSWGHENRVPATSYGRAARRVPWWPGTVCLPPSSLSPISPLFSALLQFLAAVVSPQFPNFR